MIFTKPKKIHNTPSLSDQNILQKQDSITLVTSRHYGLSTALTLGEKLMDHPLQIINREAVSYHHMRTLAKASTLILLPCPASLITHIYYNHQHTALARFIYEHCGRVVLVPAMSAQMWRHRLMQYQLLALEERNILVIPPKTISNYKTLHLAETDDIYGILTCFLNKPW